MSLRIFAPAKINLMLHVTGRRDDGYHLLETLAVFADVGDYISFEKSDGLHLEISGIEAAGIADVVVADNIVTKTALTLADYAGIKPYALMRLEKNIPAGAGIGGGSADAAAALRGLRQLWQLDIDDNELSKIGLALGADVPMCLNAKPCLVRGIGEKITKINWPDGLWLMLVNPRRHVATIDVFRAFAAAGARFNKSAFPETIQGSMTGLVELLKNMNNDLTEYAEIICPEIKSIIGEIAAEDGCLLARMSGSGSTCFGIFADAGACQRAADNMTARFSEYWVIAARIL